MIETFRSGTFDTWLSRLKDCQGRARVLARIDRLAADNPGDVRPVGAGISEMRINHGPGYRVYYMTRGGFVIVLLAGGDKSTQEADIARARMIAEQWE